MTVEETIEDPDDIIDEEFSSDNSRKVKEWSIQRFFVIPQIPILQYYEHQVTMIRAKGNSD